MAIFVEDGFAAQWVESIIRRIIPDSMDQIGVYGVSGDAQAHATHLGHRKNPAISEKLKSICILDGNSEKAQDLASGVIKLPGAVPEAEVFNYVCAHINELSMQLAVALHLSPEADPRVKKGELYTLLPRRFRVDFCHKVRRSPCPRARFRPSSFSRCSPTRRRRGSIWKAGLWPNGAVPGLRHRRADHGAQGRLLPLQPVQGGLHGPHRHDLRAVACSAAQVDLRDVSACDGAQGHFVHATRQGNRHHPEVGLVRAASASRGVRRRSRQCCAASSKLTKPMSAARRTTSTRTRSCKAGRGTVGKTPVLGMRERGGKTVAMPIAERPTCRHSARAIHENVEVGSTHPHR